MFTGTKFSKCPSWLMVAFMCTAALLLLSCSEDTPSGPEDTATGDSTDLPGAVAALVEADSPATLETGTGIVVTFPAGAVPADTLVTVTPVVPLESDGRGIVGVRFEPEGLELNQPARVSFPLPPEWVEENDPLILGFYGNDPTFAYSTSEFAEVMGSPGNYTAEVDVTHFSGLICASNCHNGTIKAILAHYEAEGCDANTVVAEANRNYSGVNVPMDGCGDRPAKDIQALLDTYFDDLGGYNEGEDVPGHEIADIIQAVRDGRQIALGFRAGQWGERGGVHNFLPAEKNEDFAHSAVLELVDGEVQMRNTVVVGPWRLAVALGGNTLFYPAADLNAFRRLLTGEATEMEVCGQLLCLNDPSMNQYGIETYGPLETRRRPWTAVRIYVEKERYVNTTPCEQAENFFVPSGETTIAPTDSLSCWQASATLAVTGWEFPDEIHEGQPAIVEVSADWGAEGSDVGTVEMWVDVTFFNVNQEPIREYALSGSETWQIPCDTSHINFETATSGVIQIVLYVFVDCVEGSSAHKGRSLVQWYTK